MLLRAVYSNVLDDEIEHLFKVNANFIDSEAAMEYAVKFASNWGELFGCTLIKVEVVE